MQPVLVIAIIGGIIMLLLMTGGAAKPVRWIGQGIVKLIIGAVFLFFLNVLGSQAGIHVPINLATTAVSGLLGIPGVAALAAIHFWVIG